MTKHVLFIHSAGPQEPGLGSEPLVKLMQQALGQSYKLICPAMPNPENPDYNDWKRCLEKQLEIIDEDIILAGHSLGGSVLLKLFSEMPYQKTVSGLIVIAAPFWGEKNWDRDEFKLKRNFASHLAFIPRIFLYHSRDDLVVPYEHVFRYAESLPNAVLRISDHHGHNFSSPCPELISDIKAL